MSFDRTRAAIAALDLAEGRFRDDDNAETLADLERAETELGRAFADDTPQNDRAVAESIVNSPRDIAWVRWLAATH